jgi:hypothetical protein
MKIALVVILIALSSSLSHAQKVSIEKGFERDRRSLSLVRFTIGEDATSGFYYLVYKNKSNIRKIRAIWNGGCCNAPRVEDFYFKDGTPILYVKLSVKKERLDAVIKGSNTPLRPEEKLYLRESRLVMWIENGKTIPSSDPGWKEKEKFVLEQVKDMLETYRMYKEGKL